jgi:hypothetical protein
MDTSLRSLLAQNKTTNAISRPSESKDLCSPGFKKHLTLDQELLADDDYKVIINLIENFWNLGIIQRGAGFCLSVADTLNKVLKTKGIDSELVECELVITTENPPTINMVGQDYNPVISEKQINCHVVCVTKTKIPMLIDISVADYENLTGVVFVCERLQPSEEADLCKATYPNCSYFYSKKLNSILPDIHQKSIVDRIKTDKKIFSDLSRLYLLLYVAIGISSLNFIRGGYDFYAKYINKTNGFGPQKTIIISPRSTQVRLK